MSRFRPFLRLVLLMVIVLVMSQVNRAAADLPPCDTYCNCQRACYVDNCQVNGYPQSCGDWGICEFSCYCGGEC
jgi:hypothetical protein